MFLIEIILIFLALFAGLVFWYGRFSSALVAYHEVIIRLATAVILMSMGYDIGLIPHIYSQLYDLAKLIMIFVITIFLITAGLFYLCFKLHGLLTKNTKKTQLSSLPRLELAMFKDSFKYLLYVAVGFSLARMTALALPHMELVINVALYVLIFVIGQQLHLLEIKLRHLFLNATAVGIALLSVAATWLSAIVVACMVGMDWNVSLAIVSGFGWYSLSGILVGQIAGPELGFVAFSIDLIREMIVILMVPVLARLGYAFVIGYAGASAMDVTLPVLKKVVGQDRVILCIISGFVLSIATPVFIPFWLSF